MTQATLLTNVRIFDGSGADRFAGEVLVVGNRIEKVVRGHGQVGRESGMDVVNGAGSTLMPGLVEAHAHISYFNMAQPRDNGDYPREEAAINTLLNAKLMLDSGFTSLYSAASSKLRTEIAVRNAINEGKFPGPRLRAASPELTSTGGLGDVNKYDTHHHHSFEWVADGADEVRKAVRTFIREGVDNVKLNISGDDFGFPVWRNALGFTEEEVAAAAVEAHARGAWLSGHARSDAAVRLALKHGFRVIYHCDYVEGETFDLLEARKDSIFLAPAIGIIYASVFEGSAFGITPEVAAAMQLPEMLDLFPKVYGELWKRGLRILPGGDYGFAWNPIGNNARDLEHFVTMLGLAPAQALMAATKWGGELMGLDLGQVKPGYLADLLLVKGDPTKDVRLLQDRDNITMIMKDGHIYKRPGTS